MNRFFLLLCNVFLVSTACTLQPETGTAIPSPLPALASSPTFPQEILSTFQSNTTLPLPTSTGLPNLQVCSPLQDIPLDQAPSLVSNPYHPPPPGSDDPHHGVDLAVSLPNNAVAVSGHPVQAALRGKVAAVINDRFPYGNAVIIETPLEDAPAEWWQPAQIPATAPTIEYRSALTCPSAAQQQQRNESSGGTGVPIDSTRRSLYVLYAHLLQPVAMNIDDAVACGQVFGAVGSSGNALNPHLHFETRVGPSGMTFTSMAHYDNSATSGEMSSYCLWRINGLFQLVDPLKVLALSSTE